LIDSVFSYLPWLSTRQPRWTVACCSPFRACSTCRRHRRPSRKRRRGTGETATFCRRRSHRTVPAILYNTRI